MTNSVGDYLVMIFFIKCYFRKYNITEIETLHVGTAWWKADPIATFAHKYSTCWYIIGNIISTVVGPK